MKKNKLVKQLNEDINSIWESVMQFYSLFSNFLDMTIKID